MTACSTTDNDLGLIDVEEVKSKTLLIDGDIVVYQPCCIYNEDSDHARAKIARAVNRKIDSLMLAAGCNKYIMFVTTKFNFRDQLVDDYKANRDDKERPINLGWAKRWAGANLNSHFYKGLEADDLIGIHASDDTVIWSIDKDLRQIPGKHINDATQEVITVSNLGSLKKGKKKIYFEGTIGFYYQLLIGDSTDNIIGCAKKVPTIWKSGPNKGQVYQRRSGVGPTAAYDLLLGAAISGGTEDEILDRALSLVITEYKKIYGEGWKEAIETQGNLLWMVRDQTEQVIERWTYDGRLELFDLELGEIIDA